MSVPVGHDEIGHHEIVISVAAEEERFFPVLRGIAGETFLRQRECHHFARNRLVIDDQCLINMRRHV
jgi:hypothetical protein